MVAVLSPAPSSRPVAPLGRPVGSRPALRVLPGGRSAPALAATYRRRRVVAALLVVTVLVVGWGLAQAAFDVAGGWAAPRPAPIDGPTVVVEAETGDTLWTLARRVQPSGDVRPTVEAMLAERGTTELQVGDRVRVPAG